MPFNLLTLFFTFLKSGGLVFGDGYATIYPLRKALVQDNQWMTEADFNEHLTIVQAMPGIFNINLAAYVGMQLNGWKGCLTSLAGMILPPFIFVLIFATFFDSLCQFPLVESFLRGARPAIVALIALPCIQMWKKSTINLSTVWIPVGAAIGVGVLGLSPSLIVITLAVLGFIYGIITHLND